MKFQDRLTLMRRVPPELVHANDGGTAQQDEVERWLDRIKTSGESQLPPDDERMIRGLIADWTSADLTHRLAVVSHLHDLLPRSQGLVPFSVPDSSSPHDTPCILDGGDFSR